MQTDIYSKLSNKPFLKSQKVDKRILIFKINMEIFETQGHVNSKIYIEYGYFGLKGIIWILKKL